VQLRLRLRLSAILFALLLGLAPTAATRAAEPSIFGTEEIYTPGVERFHKWADMARRWQEQQAGALDFCAPGESERCMPREWLRLVALLRPLEPLAKLATVNTLINRYPYVSSMANWRQLNYWETPFEFLARSGQCQDYAIAKYMLLRASGMAASELRVVVLRDMRQSADHAVLVAYVGGESLILDNQLPEVVASARITWYEPYYSINETGWWLHTPNPLRIAALALR